MRKIARNALCLLLVCLLCAGFAQAAAAQEAQVFSEQLTEAELRFYEEIGQPQNIAYLRAGEMIPLKAVTGTYYSRSELEEIVESYMNAAMNACAVYQREHQELFWCSGTKVNASYSMSGGSYTLQLTVGSNLRDNWAPGGRSIDSDEITIRTAVQRIAQDARKQGGLYQQLQYAHDWLTQHNVYNERAAAQQGGNELPWSPLSALTDVDQPVCEGYARAFKLICDELGVPCILVDGLADGGPHMWNYVFLGGNWYGVDVTWDDPTLQGVSSVVSGSESHKYFLAGADTPVDGARTFSQGREPSFDWLTERDMEYPALAAQACPSDVEDAPQSPFRDVLPDDYFAEAVLWAKETGVTDGTSPTTFSPQNTVRRGQAVTFLWRAMGEPEPATRSNPFNDVRESDYFYKAVLWAVENGITDGTSETTFSPTNPVTRGQMITFLWRTIGKPGETGAGPWYADAENWGNNNGYLSGTAELYTTGAECPRGDVVYYLWQAVA